MKKETKKQIDIIYEYLNKKYGTINPEWNTIINLLADNIDLYKECKESVKLNGIYDPNTGKKNPLIASLKDIQAQIMKQIQHLGLSPYAASKIKDSTDDDSEDFISKLTGEDE